MPKRAPIERTLRRDIIAAGDWRELEATLASVQRHYERGDLQQSAAEDLALLAAEVSRFRPETAIEPAPTYRRPNE